MIINLKRKHTLLVNPKMESTPPSFNKFVRPRPLSIHFLTLRPCLKLKDKFQAAKDAFDESNEKLVTKLTEVIDRCYDDIDPAYRKMTTMHFKLFQSFQSAFGALDSLDVSDYVSPTKSSSSNGSSDHISATERKRSQTSAVVRRRGQATCSQITLTLFA